MYVHKHTYTKVKSGKYKERGKEYYYYYAVASD